MSLVVKLLDSSPFKLGQSVVRACLSPLVSGSLLVYLAYAPGTTIRIHDEIGRRVNLDPHIVVRIIQAIFILGVLNRLNRLLNYVALNSWRLGGAAGWNWPNEVAVVTGGCGAIGYDMAQRLAQRQVKVAILDIQSPPESIESNRFIQYYKCDVTSPESVQGAAESIRQDLGQPSILINNAGITKPLPILDLPHSFLQKIFNVNCLAHWITVQNFLPDMIKRNHGHVVTVASIASFVALPRGADYSATKAAALSFHESLATELKCFYKASGVLTTVVHPSFVRTPLITGEIDKLESRGIPLLTAEEVSNEVVAQVFARRGGQVIVPRLLAGLSGIRGWPSWMQEVLRDALGRAAKEA